MRTILLVLLGVLLSIYVAVMAIKAIAIEADARAVVVSAPQPPPPEPLERGKVQLGMTTERVEWSVGKPPPEDITIMANASGTDEFWHYDGGMLHFRDGILAGWTTDGRMSTNE